MNPEELNAFAEKAKQVAAEAEGLRRESEARIKEIVEFSKEQEQANPKLRGGAVANLMSPAFLPPKSPPPQSASL